MITDTTVPFKSTVDDYATGFDAAFDSGRCWLELASGMHIELPVVRWRARSAEGDALLLDPCRGPSLDVGCGPGRLTAALAARGVSALGIDTSAAAVRHARSRGAWALQRDVFGDVPGAGEWEHVLLADGNIGIGGDPVTLLRRVRGLAGPGASVLVELEPPGVGLQRTSARVRQAESGVASGDWFPWARVGVDAIGTVAGHAGLRPLAVRSSGGRHVAALVANGGC